MSKASLPLLKNVPPAVIKILWRPMLVLAIGLHVLVLMLPTESEKKPPKPDEKPVKITRLADQKLTSKVPGKAAPKSKPKLTVRRASTTPPIFVKPTPTPSPQGTASTSPTPSPSPTPSGGTQGAETDADTKTFTVLLNDITVRRTDTDGVEKDLPLRDQTGLVGSFLFANPENFYSDVDKELGKPGVLGFEWFPSSNDLDAFEQKLEPIYTGKGFTITKTGEYGGGPVFAVKNSTGITRYFNTVLTKDKTAVLLVVWKQSPV